MKPNGDLIFDSKVEYVLDEQVGLFKVLSNKNRLKIIYLLRVYHSLSVSDLRDRLQISKATMSSHVSLLKHVGIVSHYTQNRKMYLTLNCSDIKEICVLIESFIQKNLKLKSEELSKLEF